MASEASYCCDLTGELIANGEKIVALLLPRKHVREYAKRWNKLLGITALLIGMLFNAVSVPGSAVNLLPGNWNVGSWD